MTNTKGDIKIDLNEINTIEIIDFNFLKKQYVFNVEDEQSNLFVFEISYASKDLYKLIRDKWYYSKGKLYPIPVVSGNNNKKYFLKRKRLR